jgi:hypothetical protein
MHPYMTCRVTCECHHWKNRLQISLISTAVARKRGGIWPSRQIRTLQMPQEDRFPLVSRWVWVHRAQIASHAHRHERSHGSTLTALLQSFSDVS